MKRRNFLASLFALPFVAKPLEALAPKPRGPNYEEFRRFMRLQIEMEVSTLKAQMKNAAATRRLARALQENAPTGWKVTAYRYKASDVVKKLRAKE